MTFFEEELNNVLVETFRSVLKVEEQMLKSSDKIDLTISEMHLIEAVGKNKNIGRSISDIAEDLGVTLPSVTIAINKLVKKGHVQKVRDGQDARVVYVTLTKKGLKMDAAHRYFHENMVRSLVKGLNDDEKEVMLRGIQKLNLFFRRKLAV